MSTTKNNGDCTIKTETNEAATQPQINLDEIKYTFEVVPEHEPWYEAFRRQDTGQVTYLPLNIDFSKPFFLPYQLPPLPPLNPKVCITAFKLQQKFSEESSASTSQAHEQSAASSEGESSAVFDEDSKASTSASEEVQAELLKMIEESERPSKLKKRRYVVPGKNPRKSPRQHASTLAILGSLVHHRKRRSDFNRSRSSSDLNDSKLKLPAIKEEEERQEAEDYEEIERGIERMFEEADDKYLEVIIIITFYVSVCIFSFVRKIKSAYKSLNKEKS